MKLIMQATQVVEKALMHWPWLQKKQWQHYLHRVQKEAHLVTLLPQEKILCIGAGYLPFTALAWSQLTQTCVDAIDNQPQIVHQGRLWLDDNQLSQQVDIRCEEGCEIDASGYSLIHLAAQAAPQAQILQHLWPQLAPGTRVLIRLPHPWLKVGYESLPLDSLQRQTAGCLLLQKNTDQWEVA